MRGGAMVRDGRLRRRHMRSGHMRSRRVRSRCMAGGRMTGGRVSDRRVRGGLVQSRCRRRGGGSGCGLQGSVLGWRHGLHRRAVRGCSGVLHRRGGRPGAGPAVRRCAVGVRIVQGPGPLTGGGRARTTDRATAHVTRERPVGRMSRTRDSGRARARTSGLLQLEVAVHVSPVRPARTVPRGNRVRRNGIRHGGAWPAPPLRLRGLPLVHALPTPDPRHGMSAVAASSRPPRPDPSGGRGPSLDSTRFAGRRAEGRFSPRRKERVRRTGRTTARPTARTPRTPVPTTMWSA